jgi:hypothetical protein
MESLTILAIPIYQKLGKQYPNLTERREATKQYILNEIARWGIKETDHINSYFFKPVEFKGTQNSKPFDVRLMYDDNSGLHELKFGNLNASTDSEKFEWNKNDPYKLQKALFLNDIINKKVIPLLQNDTIKGIQFEPYDGDGLGDDRLSYFSNMYNKLGNGFTWYKEDNTYYIKKK